MLPSIYLAVNDPAALRRRMHAGPTAETRPVQRTDLLRDIVSVAALLVVSALDHRFGWSTVPLWLVVAGDVLVAVGLVLAQWVVIQNSYAAANDHRRGRADGWPPRACTGLCAIRCTPAALIMMLGTPLALDSYWGLAVVDSRGWPCWASGSSTRRRC